MKDLRRHPHFETWRDPETGIESFILKARVASVQQSFYFVTPSVSPDENWLWFQAAFPPNEQKVLGVVSLDPDRPQIQLFLQAGIGGGSPMVAPESDAVYFCMSRSVLRLDLDGSTRVLVTLPEDYIRHRRCGRIATHLTLSADGKYFLLDGDIGNFWWVGIGDIQTGEVKILKEFAHHHNHAQFSPTDPKLFVIPEDWWRDPVSGHLFELDHRLWLMDIDGTRYEPVRPRDWDSGHKTNASHEWWSQDGMLCWNDYDQGPYECDPYTLEATHVWKRPLCHVHCSSDRRYWCADESPYKWDQRPLEILFFDRQRDQEIHIVSAMPQPPIPDRGYHLDPHPQFSPKDTWVVYTTTVRGMVDVALTPVEHVLEKF